MSIVLYCEEFNKDDLGGSESSLKKKFDAIIKDLEESGYTSQGDIKLIKGDGDIRYFRAKLSDSDRLLFTSIRHNNEDAFVILEVILNHDYQKSKFLKDKEKIKNIKITDQNNEEVSDKVEIEDTPQVRWLGKFITLSAKQEDIVKDAEKLPLIVSGSAGSGKTSVALEKFRKIEEKFEEGKVLYITKSKNLIKQSKELYEYVYWDETADKFKTGIPDRIEFLSLHEFLERQAEDIKGKKPISRDKFFSWFNEICKKDKFKEYKKDGDKIFEEFTAVIAGGGLKEEEYKELGSRQAIFSKEKRDTIYSLFEKYKEFIEKDSEYYDPNLIAHECTEEKIYDAVVVDEVQDLTESTLNLILKSLKDESKGNFLLCGDVNQVIHPSFFSLSKLKSFLHRNTPDKELSVYVLEKNYRNSEQVIELANRVLHLKNYCFASEDKITADKKEAFFMESDTKNIGNVNFITENKKQKEISEKVSSSTNWAVLVLDNESKEDARKLFDTPLVFNIHEAKGLEFENVILYKFMSCGAYNGIRNIVKGKDKKIEDTISKIRDSYDGREINTSRSKDKEDKSFEEFKFYMNALYVGVTRAMDSICIMDKKHDLLEVIKPEEEKILNIEDIKKEESTPEEWKNMALKLIDQGNMEQAREIAETKLLNKEYAEEVMSALKAKGCYVETQDSYKAISELKTEPQKSSPMVLHEKRGQSPNKKKKLTKKELEENTNRLFSALKNGNLQEAKRLIRQGVNVDPTKDNKDYTPLHYAAKNGSKDVAQLLLDRGADIDAKDSDVCTPLYIAATFNHYDVVQFLLNNGADVNAKAKLDCTPLHVAAQNGHDIVVQLLLDNKADIYAQTHEGCTPLYLAAEDGRTSVVQLLLDNGADINKYNKKGGTPLHIAAEFDHFDVVELLLKYGADVKINKNNGCTALHVAADYNNYDVVQLLLNNGANVNAMDDLGSTPLHWAAGKGNKKIVDVLLAKNVIDVNATNKDGVAALHLAVYRNDKEIVNALLEKDGVNVNIADTYGLTPLHAAAEKACEEVVDALLRKNGIKINKQDKKGWTPLHCAAYVGSKKIVDALLVRDEIKINKQSKDGSTPLHVAARGKSKEIVNALLRKDGIKINEREKNGVTPLYAAAHRGNKEIVDALLQQKGIDVNATHNDGITPLHLAAREGNSDITELLLKHEKIDVNAKDQEDYTPLHAATRNGHKDVVELLLKCEEIDVNAKSQKGVTPLCFAAQNCKKNIVELLLKHEAEVNAKTDQDITPLHSAAQYNSADVVEFLLKRRADVNAKTNQGCTPLHFAAIDGKVKIAELLLKYNAEINTEDKNGKTPLHSAASNDSDDVAKLLLKYNADVNAKNQKGATPLHTAVSTGSLKVVKLLLQHGAQVDSRGRGSYTPLHLAAYDGYQNVITLLLQHRADVNAKSNDGKTPLLLALIRGYSEVVDLLLADPNINVGCIDLKSISSGKEDDKRKLIVKKMQDSKLFNKVKDAANEKDTNKLDVLLKEIKELLKSKTEHGFKPSLNYSPDSNDENTTIKIAIKAGGKLLELLHNYAEKNIGTDTEIFKQLKQAIEQEKPQPQLYSSTVSRSSNPGLLM